MSKTYRVTVTGNFPAPVRRRAGVEVPADGGYEGELTAEQLKAIKADPCLSVSEATAPEDNSAKQAEADQIVQDAKVKAEEFVNEANTQAAATKKEADEYADRVRKEADEYATQKRAEADAASKTGTEGDKKADPAKT